jgi:hypothetical protein
MGYGCEEGMGPLSDSFRKRIIQFELNRVAKVEVFMRKKKAGELVLVQKPGSSRKKRAKVLKWSKTEVAILYEGDWTKQTELQTREKVASARVFRTPPALSDAYLDKVAVELGCIRDPPNYKKQLQYEMRKARKFLIENCHKNEIIEKDTIQNTRETYKVRRVAE